jgi:tellurite methyltransferase
MRYARPYDEGYEACPCFWGRDPGSLLLFLEEIVQGFAGLSVLDLGCGEGKNAIYLARRGAVVRAIDYSPLAIKNAQHSWADFATVRWEIGDVVSTELPANTYDVVIAYGLLHCLSSCRVISDVVNRMKNATKPGGYNLVCSMNDRFQDLSGHRDLIPCLLSHLEYLKLYEDWMILRETDADLREAHPHNGVWHTHSMTRLVSQR